VNLEQVTNRITQITSNFKKGNSIEVKTWSVSAPKINHYESVQTRLTWTFDILKIRFTGNGKGAINPSNAGLGVMCRVLTSPYQDQEGNKLMFLTECREFPSAPCPARRKKNLKTARVSMLMKPGASLTCFRACFLPGRAKNSSAPLYGRLIRHMLQASMHPWSSTHTRRCAQIPSATSSWRLKSVRCCVMSVRPQYETCST